MIVALATGSFYWYHIPLEDFYNLSDLNTKSESILQQSALATSITFLIISNFSDISPLVLWLIQASISQFNYKAKNNSQNIVLGY